MPFLRRRIAVIDLSGPSWHEARRGCGISPGVTQAICLRRLVDAGRLRHLGRGLYVVVDPARETPPLAIADGAFSGTEHLITIDAALARGRAAAQRLAVVSGRSPEPSQEVVVASDVMTGAADAAAEDTMPKKTWRPRPGSRQNAAPAGGGAVYGLGMIGAMVYFFRSAVTGWDYVLAIPKASVWPAILVFKLLKSFYG